MFQNDYEAYWTFLDLQKNGDQNPLLPNIMRNILEHFLH